MGISADWMRRNEIYSEVSGIQKKKKKITQCPQDSQILSQCPLSGIIRIKEKKWQDEGLPLLSSDSFIYPHFIIVFQKAKDGHSWEQVTIDIIGSVMILLIMITVQK